MTRSELQALSQAHSVALVAMVAKETREVPYRAAVALVEAASDHPELVVEARQFLNRINAARGDVHEVTSAGRRLRDAVCRLMAFRPVDAGRVDVHG